MLRVNLRNGKTLPFDLLAPAEEERWRACQEDPEFQRSVSGIALLHDGVLHSLPVPVGFSRVAFEATIKRNGVGPAAASIACYSDDVAVRLTVYLAGAGPRAVRVDMKREGRLRWAPRGRAQPVSR